MLTSRRLQMLPHSGLTLDIVFGTAGATIVHHHGSVELQFLRASSHWSVCNTGILLQEAANDVGCYDCPQGGLHLRGTDTNKLGFNVGENLTSGSGNWSSTAVSANTWDSTFEMVVSAADGPGALKVVTNPGGNPLHTYDAGIVLTADEDLIGFLIGIPGATESTDPTDFAVPYCGTNKSAIVGNVCSGVPGTPGTVRWRFVRASAGIRYYEVWEKITGTAATYYPGLLFENSVTVYVATPTQYEAADVADAPATHGSQFWRGCMVRPDGDAVVTAAETFNILTPDPTLILPVSTDQPFSVALEIGFPVDPDDLDDTEIATDESVYFAWAQQFRGGISGSSFQSLFTANTQTGGATFNAALVDYGSLIPATPYQSKHFGYVSGAGLAGQFWIKDNNAALFQGTPEGTSAGTQAPSSIQFSDGFMAGGQPAAVEAITGQTANTRNADIILRRIQIWDVARVIL